MKRRWLSVIGVFLLVAALGLAIVITGVEELSLEDGMTPATLFIVGTLFVLGGESTSIRGLEWNQFAGIGQVILGSWFAFQAGTFLPIDPTALELAMAGSFAIAGLVFVFIGIDWFRGGFYYDLSELEPGPIRAE